MRNFYPGQRVLCIDGKFHPSVWEYVNEVPIEEVPGTLPGIKSVVCWCAWRFAPLDVAESKSVAKKKKSVAKKKRTAQRRSKMIEPALV